MKNIFKSLMICSVLCGSVISVFGVRSGLTAAVEGGMDGDSKTALCEAFDAGINEKIVEIIDKGGKEVFGKRIFDAAVSGAGGKVIVEEIGDELCRLTVWEVMKKVSAGTKIKDIEVDGVSIFGGFVTRKEGFEYAKKNVTDLYTVDEKMRTYCSGVGIDAGDIGERFVELFETGDFDCDFLGILGGMSKNPILEGVYEGIKKVYSDLAKTYNAGLFDETAEEKRQGEIEKEVEKYKDEFVMGTLITKSRSALNDKDKKMLDAIRDQMRQLKVKSDSESGTDGKKEDKRYEDVLNEVKSQYGTVKWGKFSESRIKGMVRDYAKRKNWNVIGL